MTYLFALISVALLISLPVILIGKDQYAWAVEEM
jgi:hypothetical protein